MTPGALRCTVSSDAQSSRHGDEQQLRPEKWWSVRTSWVPQRAFAGRCYACPPDGRWGRWPLREATVILQNQPADTWPSWDANPEWKRTPPFDECQQSLVAQSTGFMSADGPWVPAQDRTSCVLLCQLINPSMPCVLSGTIKATRQLYRRAPMKLKGSTTHTHLGADCMAGPRYILAYILFIITIIIIIFDHHWNWPSNGSE